MASAHRLAARLLVFGSLLASRCVYDEDCGNGVDDDGDGAADCADADCGCSTAEVCDNGRDDDGDGMQDCADADCSCAEICDNGEDDDLDGLADCADADCACWATDEDCANGADDDGDSSIDCEDDDCWSNAVCVEDCDNGVDDDADGLVDCADDFCWSSASCIEDCDNGVDDDANGAVDCADPDCASWSGCDEVCDNGIDDDGDLAVDCEDVECLGDPSCADAEDCSDGADNDADLAVDCDDSDCAAEAICLPVLLPNGSFEEPVIAAPGGESTSAEMWELRNGATLYYPESSEIGMELPADGTQVLRLEGGVGSAFVPFGVPEGTFGILLAVGIPGDCVPDGTGLEITIDTVSEVVTLDTTLYELTPGGWMEFYFEPLSSIGIVEVEIGWTSASACDGYVDNVRFYLGDYRG